MFLSIIEPGQGHNTFQCGVGQPVHTKIRTATFEECPPPSGGTGLPSVNATTSATCTAVAVLLVALLAGGTLTSTCRSLF